MSAFESLFQVLPAPALVVLEFVHDNPRYKHHLALVNQNICNRIRESLKWWKKVSLCNPSASSIVKLRTLLHSVNQVELIFDSTKKFDQQNPIPCTLRQLFISFPTLRALNISNFVWNDYVVYYSEIQVLIQIMTPKSLTSFSYVGSNGFVCEKIKSLICEQNKDTLTFLSIDKHNIITCEVSEHSKLQTFVTEKDDPLPLPLPDGLKTLVIKNDVYHSLVSMTSRCQLENIKFTIKYDNLDLLSAMNFQMCKYLEIHFLSSIPYQDRYSDIIDTLPSSLDTMNTNSLDTIKTDSLRYFKITLDNFDAQQVKLNDLFHKMIFDVILRCPVLERLFITIVTYSGLYILKYLIHNFIHKIPKDSPLRYISLFVSNKPGFNTLHKSTYNSLFKCQQMDKKNPSGIPFLFETEINFADRRLLEFRNCLLEIKHALQSKGITLYLHSDFSYEAKSRKAMKTIYNPLVHTDPFFHYYLDDLLKTRRNEIYQDD